jgi:hypothetical protein
MVFIPEIDKLLEVDKYNVSLTRKVLNDFSPTLPEAINRASVLYKTVNRIFSQNLNNHYQKLLHACREAHISNLRELKHKIDEQKPSNGRNLYSKAKAEYEEFLSRETRAALLVRLGILYVTAAADILRMRLTGPQSYMRLQCETIALMKLMHDDATVAHKWRKIQSEGGRIFYKKYQSKLKSILKSFSLDREYDSASAIALHSRFSGLALGLRASSSIKDGKVNQDIRINVQEFDPEKPHVFLVFVLQLLRVQQRIFSNLPTASPEIKDELFVQTYVPNYERDIDELFKIYQEKYPIKHMA